MIFYIIISLWIIYLIAVIIFFQFRKKWAIKKVKCSTEEEKISYLNDILKPFGFTFDACQDIIISQNDCWQRDMGYANLYDYKAPFFNMVMDSLPIFFKYDNKEYRIEFWKGQYGITTGAEIGVYVRDCSDLKGFYRAISDDELLNMQFTLTKKCELFSCCDYSWWLTGFDVGVFSKPKNLKMSICLCFPNQEMLCEFVTALINSGIPCSNIDICDTQVCFDYCCPNNYKPNHKHRIIKCFMQICNFINCKLYMWFTRYFNRTLDKLTYLRYLAPCLSRLVIRLSIPRRKKFKSKKK